MYNLNLEGGGFGKFGKFDRQRADIICNNLCEKVKQCFNVLHSLRQKNFRLQKINKTASTLNREATKYRLVAKKVQTSEEIGSLGCRSRARRS